MIDMGLLRGPNHSKTVELIARKDPGFDVGRLCALDEQVRVLRTELDAARAERNQLSKPGASGVSQEARARSVELGEQIKQKEVLCKDLESAFEAIALCCPNIIEADVPAGNKESNKVVRTWGTKPQFSFAPQHHLALNERLGWFDFERAAVMSGSQFVLYKNDGVKLVYALTRLMLKHNVARGFAPVIPPSLVSTEALVRNGSLPKFEGDYYQLRDDPMALIPTSEVCLTSLHADMTLPEDQLPVRNTAWTSCFRREAGGYGASERGLIRIHQFEKVELYSLAHPDQSGAELDYMVETAESLLRLLGIPHQVVLLAAQDCSFGSARTYDLEIWMPGQGRFYEVSSCSNCTDFQARRSGIRFKPEGGKQTRLVHTLNASSLALPRLIVALMENFQQADGSVQLPKLLQDEMDALW